MRIPKFAPPFALARLRRNRAKRLPIHPPTDVRAALKAAGRKANVVPEPEVVEPEVVEPEVVEPEVVEPEVVEAIIQQVAETLAEDPSFSQEVTVYLGEDLEPKAMAVETVLPEVIDSTETLEDLLGVSGGEEHQIEEPPTIASLEMSRRELETLAGVTGITRANNKKKFPNKQSLVDAIKELRLDEGTP